MANTVRIKRRAAGGASGAPSSLQNAELAFNEQDNTLYYGKGTGGAGGSASQVIAIAGPGSYVNRTDDQTIDGVKTFTQTIVGSINGNAATAYKLATARNIGLSGDATGSASFDGSANATIAVTLANSGVTAGSYGSSTAVPVVTVDAKGRVTDVTTAPITGALNFTGDVTGSGQTGSNTALTLANSGVTAGTYTKVTVDAKGRATAGAQANLSDIASPSADFDFNGKRLTGLADPTSAQDAATKNYVDMTVQGLDPKQSVKAASTANISSLSGAMTVDGVSLIAGDRVLVKNQSTASQNGIYVVASGSWVRSDDANTWNELVSAYVFAEQGTVNAEMGFICTVDQGGTLGTTAVNFQQFNGAGQVIAGAGLTKTGNTIDVVTADTGRIVVNADNIDLATTGVSAGTYTKVTVDAYGRATGGSNPTTLSGYGITDAQALDATLTALAAITTAADKLIYATGADAFATTDFPSYGRSLAASASAAAARSTLGLGTIATQDASNVNITGGAIDGITFDCGTF